MNEFNEVKSLVRRALKLKRKKEHHRALEILREGREKYPDNNYLLTSLADTYLRLKQTGRAQKLAEDILVSDPENQRALIVLGNVHYRKYEYEKAEEYFMKADRLQSTPYIGGRLIRTHLKKGEAQKAMDLCQQWLSERPDDKRFKKLKVDIYQEMGAKKRAEELLDELKAGDDFAFKKKIKLRMEDKSPGEAKKELQQLLSLDKYARNKHLHNLLGEILYEQQQFEEAAAAYRQALLLDPEDTHTRSQLGFSLYKAGEYEEALPYLKESFLQKPEDYHLRSTLQAVFRKLGNIEQGMNFFADLIKETGLNNLWGVYNKLKKEQQKQKKGGQETEKKENEEARPAEEVDTDE